MVHIKDDVAPFETADFWEDLLENKKLDVSKYVKHPVASNVIREALVVLRGFKSDMQKAGMIHGL